MERYRNLSGSSAVAGYEIGSDYIIIQFNGGSIYTYDYGSAGRLNVETMKTLAARGSGLNSFINSNVKYKYSSKG
jgi:hypothetical protein